MPMDSSLMACDTVCTEMHLDEEEEEEEDEEAVYWCNDCQDSSTSPPRISFSQYLTTVTSLLSTQEDCIDHDDDDDADDGADADADDDRGDGHSYSAGFEFCFKRDAPCSGYDDDDDDGCYSAEFEFSCKSDAFSPIRSGECFNAELVKDTTACDPEGRMMLPADELFMDGKLLPLLHVPMQSLPSTPRPSPPPPADRCCHHDVVVSNWSSLASLRVDSVSCNNRVCLNVNSSPPSPSSPVLLKASSSKYSTKFKDFFKAQLMCDGSITASCRIPLPPRSLWPFPRSNSAGEVKTTTSTTPTLPQRSNSAGESNTNRRLTINCRRHAAACEAVQPSVSMLSNMGVLLPAEGSSFDESVQSVITVTETIMKVRGSPGIPRRMSKQNMHSTENFARGSPGRRGSSNGKVNSGHIMLRNLERCCAERKLGRESWSGSERRSSYPAGITVTPVLNVAVYKGGKSKSGLFGFVNLFFARKEKAKTTGVSINNWRKGIC